jgi:hypothetical protein
MSTEKIIMSSSDAGNREMMQFQQRQETVFLPSDSDDSSVVPDQLLLYREC